MKTSIFALTFFLASLVEAAECLPARVEKDFPAHLANGAFMRFSPNADYAIAWAQSPTESSGSTYLVDLRGAKPKVIKTVLAVESYPVEGDWELIGSAGMGTSYYELSELLSNKFFKKSAFRASVGGLYHVSGTLPSDSPQKKIIRTVSYDKLEFADTEVEMKDGKVQSSRPVKRSSQYLCANLGKKVMVLKLCR